MREIYSSVDLGDKGEFEIKRFSAMTGMKVVRLILAKAAPILPKLMKLFDGMDSSDDKIKNVAEMLNDEDFSDLLSDFLESVSDDDIDRLVRICLSHCYKRLRGAPNGRAPVIDANGNYGIEDIEYDFPLTLRLCVEAIRWGASDFFGENALNGKGATSSSYLKNA